MSRTIVSAFLATAVLLAGCQSGGGTGGFVQEHKTGLIGAGIGAGIGALAGQAVGHNSSSTLLGAAVGGGIGYLLGNQQDKKRAEQYNPSTTTPLTGTQWRVEQLTMANAPAYREMYLSFEPNSQLVTTTILPDGQETQAVETYRISDSTLIINNPAQGGQPGYVINAAYTMNGNTMTINSQDFGATLVRVNQVPAVGRPALP